MGKVSIVDIAKEANVSIATVSRVLNKTGRYSASTESKVMQLVEEYGYTANATAKSLRTSRSFTIGMIVPDITNEFYARIVRAVEAAILPQGYSVFLCDSREDETIESMHVANLMAKSVDGMIYLSGQSEAAGVPAARHIPSVYVDRCPENAAVTIQSDNRQGGMLATQELIRKGCRKIAFLPDCKQFATTQERFAGYQDAHRQAGLELLPELEYPEAGNYEGAKELIGRAWDRLRRPFDGVFATNDRIALGALHALVERRVIVPGQVRLVGFDDISLSAFCDVPMTTITQDTTQIGERCVEILLRMMNGEEIARQDIYVPVSLHVRNST